MKAKFKIGDIVTVNARFLEEGRHYFGKELKNKNFRGEILKVYENTNDEKDGFGDVWPNVYIFKGNQSICELFLRLA